MDVLVIADLHYASSPERRSPIPARAGLNGTTMIRKALLRLRHDGVKPGLVILLGDILESPDEDDLREIGDVLSAAGVSVIAIPGNHDQSPQLYEDVFGTTPGLIEVGGYGFLVFRDDVGEGDVTTRSGDSIASPAEAAKEHPELPLIALQHNPVYPDIDKQYPYMLTNTAEVRQSYVDAGVVLSLSGHYHSGQPCSEDRGVKYHTVAAACEMPYSFTHVKLGGREAAVQARHLRMDVPGLWDVHTHTQFAYCSSTASAPLTVELAESLGLAGMCVTEHSFQLYFDRPDAWSYRWKRDDGMVDAAWCRPGRGRMSEYREFVASLKARLADREISVSYGLEVDIRADGSLLLSDEDRDGWDILVGAIHNIHDASSELSDAEAGKLFLRDVELLLAAPVQVLAHPFRWFRRENRPVPMHLYPIVAKMLADAGVAAEANYHTNSPDSEFYAECVRAGAMLAFASDTHEIEEAGELYPHLKLMEKAGVGRDELNRVLYRPG